MTLLHPVACLAVKEVMKVRHIPAQIKLRCSACTRWWCRSATGLHAAAGQVHVGVSWPWSWPGGLRLALQQEANP